MVKLKTRKGFSKTYRCSASQSVAEYDDDDDGDADVEEKRKLVQMRLEGRAGDLRDEDVRDVAGEVQEDAVMVRFKDTVANSSDQGGDSVL